MAQRAALVVTLPVDSKRAEDIAWNMVEKHGDSDVESVAWHIEDDLPSSFPISVADQLSAHKRDAGPDAVYIVIFMGTTEEVFSYAEEYDE